MEDIPFQHRLDAWFMDNGAAPHFSSDVKDYLNNIYCTKWIGWSGPVKWPPHSPDLMPADWTSLYSYITLY